MGRGCNSSHKACVLHGRDPGFDTLCPLPPYSAMLGTTQHNHIKKNTMGTKIYLWLKDKSSPIVAQKRKPEASLWPPLDLITGWGGGTGARGQDTALPGATDPTDTAFQHVPFLWWLAYFTVPQLTLLCTWIYFSWIHLVKKNSRARTLTFSKSTFHLHASQGCSWGNKTFDLLCTRWHHVEPGQVSYACYAEWLLAFFFFFNEANNELALRGPHLRK